MITRNDIIVILFLIAAFIAYYIFDGGNKPADVKRIKIEMRDSVIIAQRDSAITRAIFHEARADSLQKILDKQSYGISQIEKKYNAKKNHINSLPVDSVLDIFSKIKH